VLFAVARRREFLSNFAAASLTQLWSARAPRTKQPEQDQASYRTPANTQLSSSTMRASRFVVTAGVAIACLATSVVAAPVDNPAAILSTVEKRADTITASEISMRLGQIKPLSQARIEEKIAAGEASGFPYIAAGEAGQTAN
jgi:hypothetical protein